MRRGEGLGRAAKALGSAKREALGGELRTACVRFDTPPGDKSFSDPVIISLWSCEPVPLVAGAKARAVEKKCV